jgi:carbamoylphosphate synthase small subunit
MIISKTKSSMHLRCDTRALVGYIRDNGAQNAVISGRTGEDLKLCN